METWKHVCGYQKYEVSNYGNVRRGKRILKQTETPSGYLTVHLCENGIRKRHRINRLVALAFIDNPNGFPVVNHKDENKKNNCVDNLEWCDHKYNANYGTRNARISKKIINLDTGEVFASTCDAAKYVNRPPTSITRCCKGRRKHCGGFRWGYYAENNLKDMTGI